MVADGVAGEEPARRGVIIPERQHLQGRGRRARLPVRIVPRLPPEPAVRVKVTIGTLAQT